MQNSKALKTILVISGLIVTGVGGTVLFMPVTFYAGNGIDLGGNISLLNEIRAGGGGLLVVGMLIVSGAFVARLTFTSTVISMLMFLSFGTSRILSMAIDGMPAEGLVNATVLEMVMGLAGAFALLKYRENE